MSSENKVVSNDYRELLLNYVYSLQSGDATKSSQAYRLIQEYHSRPKPWEEKKPVVIEEKLPINIDKYYGYQIVRPEYDRSFPYPVPLEQPQKELALDIEIRNEIKWVCPLCGDVCLNSKSNLVNTGKPQNMILDIQVREILEYAKAHLEKHATGEISDGDSDTSADDIKALPWKNDGST